MEQEGLGTLWFSFSAADNHWNDLHQLSRNGANHPDFKGNEKKEAKYRRKMVREAPHIVDQFFMERVEAMFQTIFGKKGIRTKFLWFRVEYQRRGVAHIHGCLQIEDDPGMAKVAQKILEGRVAALALRRRNPISSELDFAADNIAGDEWYEDKDNEEAPPVYEKYDDDEYVQELVTIVAIAKGEEKKLASFHDFLLDTIHPDPPAADANRDSRCESTKFKQGT